MPTQTDVIQQVAEAKCPESVSFFTRNHPKNCSTCQGTGLRWRPLSREKQCHAPLVYCRKNHPTGHGREPDVTLEKVLPLIYSLEKASPIEYIITNPPDTYTGLWAACHSWYDKGDPKQMTYYEKTPLEAACAALLATVEG